MDLHHPKDANKGKILKNTMQPNNTISIAKKLRKNVGEAIQQYQMIEEGDKIMVCLSGGKDSYTLLDLLIHAQKVAPIHFELLAVNLDQKQPGFPTHTLPNYLKALKIPYRIIEKDTYKVVMDKTPEGKTTCSLCSRLRRGALYEAARNLGCNKLALGHHRNDIIETFLLNLFFGGKLEAMPPKFLNDAGNLTVIRPLAFCREADIEQFSMHQKHPIIPCNLCGSQENLQRKKVKEMIEDWSSDFPDRESVMFNALKNVFPSHLLDEKLYDFKNLKERLPQVD